MKRIKLTAIEDEFDDYEDMGRQEGKRWNFKLDLTPYVAICAMACAVLVVVCFLGKRFFRK